MTHGRLGDDVCTTVTGQASGRRVAHNVDLLVDQQEAADSHRLAVSKAKESRF